MATDRLEPDPRPPETLPDYLAPRLHILSIGLNPSLRSAAEGFYFAHPRNRFWRALDASGLASQALEPGPEALATLLEVQRIGFTDVVKRPTAGLAQLRARDFARGAPVLREKILRCRPLVAWFHGKEAYRRYLAALGEKTQALDWGEQGERIGTSRVFVSPNPSPANAAFSLAVLIERYAELARLRDELVQSVSG